jgi:DNA primase
MALYTRDSIERMREAVDMVALVGAKTDLRRVGSRWMGLCPFHDERTPSFSVNPEQKLFYCFGCGAKGDAIAFVRETEALDFPEAVELLAERHGVELEREREDPRAEERRQRRERLLSLLDRTTRFYSTYLWESEEARGARDYLAGRGLSEEVLKDFRVGYAPSAWDRLVTGAQRDGFKLEELAATGLGQRGRGGGFYDRFRGRIMFPLADARGRVLGFGARALRETQRPKYLNTSENEIYRKGRQLFGLDTARAQASRARRVVVVEGYTDVLALHQAGLRESVAIMGTALTQEQLTELGRAVGSGGMVYLALDADRSGREAMLRAARGAQDQELELRVVELPEGRDPAELVASDGAEEFSRRMEAALSVLEFQLERILADADLDTPVGRNRALEEARALIAAEERPVVRDDLVRRTADRLDVPAVQVTTAPKRPPAKPTEAAPAVRPAAPGPLRSEEAFLAMCARGGDRGREYLRKLDDAHLSFDLTRRARDHLGRHFDDPLVQLPEDDPDLEAMLQRIAKAQVEEDEVSEPGLRMTFLDLEGRRIEREIRQAAEGPDLGRKTELARARQDVRREIDAVMGQTA